MAQDMNLVSSFHERFSEAIENMNASELAVKAGLSKQTISAYKTGVRKPRKPTIRILAEILSLNPAWLIGCDAPKFMKYASGGSMATMIINAEGGGHRVIPECKELEEICRALNQKGLTALLAYAKLLLLDDGNKKGIENNPDDEKRAG